MCRRLQSGRLTRRQFVHGTAALATSGATLLTGCSGGDETAAPSAGPRAGGEAGAGAAAGATQFSFLAILPPETLTFAPELLADAAGYFADEGLDMNFELTRGSSQAIQLVLAGWAPLTRISQIEGMRAAANRDAPLVNVGMVIKDSTIRYVSSEQDPLREPQDFVGKTIGIPSAEGSSELELDLFLASAGVDRDSVERQVVGVTAAVYNLVEQGRIAGYAVSIDTAKILEQQRSGVVVLNPGDFMASGGQFYMASRNDLDANRDSIGKFVKAVHAALDFMIEDDGFDRTLEILRGKYSFDALNDTTIAKESLREYLRVWTSAGRESVLQTVPERWSRGYRELVEAGIVEPGADPAAWFTNEFVGDV
ncbi:MAG: ABC transporter substrate-binding protein [Gammaproteobacteria bacterium]|nr:ABC transporter substrate-binding protein [Gammaproteobacteria bacterium]